MTSLILITGAARGIGFEAARQLVAQGHRVFLAARNRAAGQGAAQSLDADACFIELDVTDDASVRRAVAEVSKTGPHLDVLVNNAAVLLDGTGDIFSLTPDALHRTLDANLAGPLRLTQAFLPLLRRSSAPRIVNVSSGAGQLAGGPQAWAPAYSISKTALNMLTRQFSGALPGVAVNSVCPGWCRTEMGGSAAPHSPAEGADTIVWLATKAPQGLTGKFLRDREPLDW